MTFSSPPNVAPSVQNIRMVMSDIDGTLITPEKNLTERAKDGIGKLRAAGLKFTVISGRASYGVRHISTELEIDQPVVSFNGGLLALPDGKVLEAHLLPAKLLPEILQCMERFGLVPFLFTADGWYVQSLDFPYVRHEADLIKTEPTVMTTLEPYFDQVLKLTGVSGDFENMGQCQKAMQELLGDRAANVN